MGQRCVTQSNPTIFTVNFKNFRYFQQDAREKKSWLSEFHKKFSLLVKKS